jgi:hypothetical protein
VESVGVIFALAVMTSRWGVCADAKSGLSLPGGVARGDVVRAVMNPSLVTKLHLTGEAVDKTCAGLKLRSNRYDGGQGALEIEVYCVGYD